jgi:uncharacterized protein YbjT (DUF2867 family)
MRVLHLVVTACATLGLATTAIAAADTVVLAGATGKSGVPLVKILQSQGYKVRAMVRDQAKGATLGPDVELVEADVTKPDTLGPAMKGATYVISVIGSVSPNPPNNPENVDYQGIVNLVDAARAASVRHFVLMSSVGAGDANPATPLNKMFGMVLLWKGKAEDYLRKSGLAYTIVRPGGLKNCEPGQVGLRLAPGDDATRGGICRSDVGLVMADALTRKEAAGKTVALISDDKAPVDAWKSAWATLPRD